jgi:hypothetical protein
MATRWSVDPWLTLHGVHDLLLVHTISGRALSGHMLRDQASSNKNGAGRTITILLRADKVIE